MIARSAERSEARSADYSGQTGRQWDPVRLLSVVVVVVDILGGPLFWDTCGPDPRAICRQNMVPLPASEGSTFGTRNSRIRGGSSNQNVVLSPFVAI